MKKAILILAILVTLYLAYDKYQTNQEKNDIPDPSKISIKEARLLVANDLHVLMGGFSGTAAEVAEERKIQERKAIDRQLSFRAIGKTHLSSTTLLNIKAETNKILADSERLAGLEDKVSSGEHESIEWAVFRSASYMIATWYHDKEFKLK